LLVILIDFVQMKYRECLRIALNGIEIHYYITVICIQDD